jgi:hypothetical protein
MAYSTVNPCRLLDTRLAGGPIAANTIRNFKVKGTLSSQGGNSSGCGVPSDATGAMINFVSVNPTGAGNLLAWAYPISTAPTASTLNFGVVAGLSGLANGIAVPICDPGVDSCTYDLRIKASVSATDVVADVVGYFRAPFPAPATCATPPCSVAICNSGNGSTVSCTTEVSHASGNCVAVSQSGTCQGTMSCAVCQGPALPASSSAICNDGGTSVQCAIATLASGSSSNGCSAVAVGGVCKGAFSCKVCRTQ